MLRILKITEEAYSVLKKEKREGFSLKRLASEAILEKYSKKRLAANSLTAQEGEE